MADHMLDVFADSEVIVAALGGEGRERVVAESADLVYHLMALLTNEGIRWSEVEAEIERRSGSGLIY